MTSDGTTESIRLNVGDPAPDFTLPTHNEGELNLSWYRGRRIVVLAFYPADWTPVCATQIPGYQDVFDEFEKYDCQLLAVSIDSIPSHVAWARSLGGISFPLMSDFYPHGRVARLYGVLTDKGYAGRVVFVIDKRGIIRHIQRVPVLEIPDNAELFKVLAELQAERSEAR
ncbi:MAG TPA: redoxin domain-containing protein [Acidobacteriota bacterium]|nr:redoxin domain-containing protein [Acidobacteriota bacterium]